MILPLCKQKVDSNLLLLLSSRTKTKHRRKGEKKGGGDSMSALCRCRGIKYNNLLHATQGMAVHRSLPAPPLLNKECRFMHQ